MKHSDITPSSVPSKKSLNKVEQTLSEFFLEYAGKYPTQLVCLVALTRLFETGFLVFSIF
jgi:hypothetical protein